MHLCVDVYALSVAQGACVQMNLCVCVDASVLMCIREMHHLCADAVCINASVC